MSQIVDFFARKIVILTRKLKVIILLFKKTLDWKFLHKTIVLVKKQPFVTKAWYFIFKNLTLVHMISGHVIWHQVMWFDMTHEVFQDKAVWNEIFFSDF